MSFGLENTVFWGALALWASMIFTSTWMLTQRIVKAPRIKACLILLACLCSLLPCVADHLPQVRGVSFAYSQPYSSAFTIVPMQIHQTDSGMSLPTQSGPVSSTVQTAIPITQFLILMWLFGTGFAFVLLLRAIWQMNNVARSGKSGAPVVAGFPFSKVLLDPFLARDILHF